MASVHEISQARTLEWIAIPFSRGSSQLRDGTHVSCIAGGFFYHWSTWEAQVFVTTVNTSYSSFSESRLKSKRRRWFQFWINSTGIKSPHIKRSEKENKNAKKKHGDEEKFLHDLRQSLRNWIWSDQDFLVSSSKTGTTDLPSQNHSQTKSKEKKSY